MIKEFGFKIFANDLVAFIIKFRSGFLFFFTGVGTVIIKILHSFRSFILFVNLNLVDFFYLFGSGF